MELSLSDIKNSVPSAIFERGQKYFKRGHVEWLDMDDEAVWGEVLGSGDNVYYTRLTRNGRRLECFCSCPYDDFCKHGVALALAALDRMRRAVPAKAGWEEALKTALGLEDEMQPAGVSPGVIGKGAGSAVQRWGTGNNIFICRLYVSDSSVKIGLRVARLGRNGLGRERPLNPFAFLPEDIHADESELRLVRCLVHLLQPLATGHTDRIPLLREFLDPCLDILSRLPRVYVDDSDEPVRFGSPVVIGARIVEDPDGGLRIMPWIKDAFKGEVLVPKRCDIYFAGRPWICEDGMFRPVVTKLGRDLLFALAPAGLRIPSEEIDRFVSRYLFELADCGVEIPGSLMRRIRDDIVPRTVLVLSENEGALVLDLMFAYGDGPPQTRSGMHDVMIVPATVGGEQCWARRNQNAESAAGEALISVLNRLGLQATPVAGTWRLIGDHALDFVRCGIPALPEGWEVYGEEDLSRFRVSRKTPTSRARVTTGIDWLDLEIGLEVDGEAATTEEILDALKEGRRYVRLKGGSHVLMPEGWRALEDLVRDISAGRRAAGDKRVRLRRYDAPAVQALLQSADVREADESWRRFSEALEKFGGIDDVPVPDKLLAKLRPYQVAGYRWLWFLREYGLNGILADDMGLGKTVQALALLLRNREAQGREARDGNGRLPSLVVVPTSLVFNWVDEIGRFAPSLKVLPLVGAGRKDDYAKLGEYDVVLTTYSLLPRDEELLTDREFDYVILDEAQRIKNAACKTAQVARRLRARHRLALTGTPLENNLMELWSVFDFLMPGFLGSAEGFAERYARPAQEGGDRGVVERLKRRVYPFILRRLKTDVARDLPPKVENVVTCELAPPQKKLYQAVLNTYRERVFKAVEEKGVARSQITILDALLKLRQVCCHPQLLKIPGNSVRACGKMEVFKELVTGIVEGGGRALVFSQFVEMLHLLRNELDDMGIRYEYLDGRTRDRKERVERFNSNEDIPIFLISLKAGGTGLNLTGASYVIHYDPWWNPAVEAQATDRAHRIGQEKRVIGYKIITRGTVEERIVELQKRKQELVEGILSGDPAVGKRLTREDLEMLFGAD